MYDMQGIRHHNALHAHVNKLGKSREEVCVLATSKCSEDRDAVVTAINANANQYQDVGPSTLAPVILLADATM
jgi:hypothetical protein